MSDQVLRVAQAMGYEIPAEVKEARSALARLDMLTRRGLAPAPTPANLLEMSDAELDAALRDAAAARAAADESPAIARTWMAVADAAFHAEVGAAVPAWTDALAADFRPVADAVVSAAEAFELDDYVYGTLPNLSRSLVDLAEVAAQAEQFLAARSEVSTFFGHGGHHPRYGALMLVAAVAPVEVDPAAEQAARGQMNNAHVTAFAERDAALMAAARAEVHVKWGIWSQAHRAGWLRLRMPTLSQANVHGQLLDRFAETGNAAQDGNAWAEHQASSRSLWAAVPQEQTA